MSSGSSGAGASGGSSGAGVGASGGVSGGAIGGGLTSALEETANKSNSFATKLKETFASINFDNLVTAFNNVKTSAEPIVTTIKDGLVWFWENILVPFAAWTIEDILPAFLNILSGALDILNAALEDIKPLLDWLWTNVLQPIAEWAGSTITDTLNAIGDALKWIADNEVAMAILEGIAIAIGLVAGAIAVYNAAMTICNVVTGVFSGIMAVLTSPITLVIAVIAALVAGIILCIQYWDEITAAASGAWENIKKAWQSAGTWFAGIWASIKKAFSKVGTWFKDTFKKAWEGVKKVFSAGGEIFVGIKDGIVDTFKTVVNALITGINKVVRLPFEGLNKILDKIYKIEVVGVKPFSWLTWRAPIPELPYLAKGGITTGATTAVIGEAGREAVLPLENNTGWMDMLADRIANRNRTPSRIVLMLDGKELGWAAIDNINEIAEQVGGCPLVIA